MSTHNSIHLKIIISFISVPSCHYTPDFKGHPPTIIRNISCLHTMLCLFLLTSELSAPSGRQLNLSHLSLIMLIMFQTQGKIGKIKGLKIIFILQVFSSYYFIP